MRDGCGAAFDRRTRAVREWLRVERPDGPARSVRWWLDHPRFADAVVPLVLAVAVTPQVVFQVRAGGAAATVYVVVSVLLIAPLVARRRAPGAVFAVVASVGAVQWWIDVQLSADVAILVALFAVAVHHPPRGLLLAAGVAEIGAVAAAVRWPHGLRPSEMAVVLSAFVVASVASGAYVRSRRRIIAMLQEQSRQWRRDRDRETRLAVAAERNRIARDVHDVVGHSLAVVVTLAAGNSGKAARHPARVDHAVGLIEQTAREALAATRQVLGTLRAGSDRRPTPTVDDLSGLVDAAAGTGLRTSLVTTGPVAEVPAAVGVAVFRVTQEAVTNVIRHADAGWLVVTVEVTADRVAVVVENDGPPALATSTRGPGFGIVGMRERVAQLGGTLDAGPTPTPGWRVAATLPLRTARAAASVSGGRA